jgi:hypothetical protein
VTIRTFDLADKTPLLPMPDREWLQPARACSIACRFVTCRCFARKRARALKPLGNVQLMFRDLDAA